VEPHKTEFKGGSGVLFVLESAASAGADVTGGRGIPEHKGGGGGGDGFGGGVDVDAAVGEDLSDVAFAIFFGSSGDKEAGASVLGVPSGVEFGEVAEVAAILEDPKACEKEKEEQDGGEPLEDAFHRRFAP